MTDQQQYLFDLSDGLDQAYAFVDVDNSAVMVKVSADHGDPFELEPSAARQLACALLILADRVEGDEHEWKRRWSNRPGTI